MNAAERVLSEILKTSSRQLNYEQFSYWVDKHQVAYQMISV